MLPALLLGIGIVLLPVEAQAYIGPGAGFAFLTSFFLMLGTVLFTIGALLAWPVMQLYRRFTHPKPPLPPHIKRAVIIGLDGLDPELAARFMEKGRLPNLQRLAAKGRMGNLGTTCPAMSPVAWSSFATGVDPSKHSIFDFLTRDPRTYTARLSSTETVDPKRFLNLGKLRIPLGKPEVRMLQRSQPFWKLLGKHRIPCSILRIPITYPPQEFDGTLLAAMCVPDLQGTQGSFTLLTAQPDGEERIGGQQVQLKANGSGMVGHVPGPPHPFREGETLELPLTITPKGDDEATLKIDGQQVLLKKNAYTEWLHVAFPLLAGVKLRGICRFRLLGLNPLRVYVTPIQIDPENPAMPISHPFIFSIFLSKLIGTYGTLGLAEDTWGLNEGVLDEDAFLEQAQEYHREREQMLFQMLDRTPKGLLACVFDATDRIQHMFMRYLDDDHPALRNGDPSSSPEAREKYRNVIEDTYAQMDEMVGRVMKEIDIDDPSNLLMVISDHGFSTFRRGVNLNIWLREQGYLVLEEGHEVGGEWFKHVDWSKTKAFALGLSGIYLNLEGREEQGIIAKKDAPALRAEIGKKLKGLVDPDAGEVAIQKVIDPHRRYKGPYMQDAPDLIIGYAKGWRASWDGVRGIVAGATFEDNTKCWSGDHCIDPAEVPGVIIANQLVGDDEATITDIAPTMLEMFGVRPPKYMDGRSLAPKKAGPPKARPGAGKKVAPPPSTAATAASKQPPAPA